MAKKYEVVQSFFDKEKKKVYVIGDSFPGNTKKERIAALLADDSPNRNASLKGAPIIKEVVADAKRTAKPKATTGN